MEKKVKSVTVVIKRNAEKSGKLYNKVALKLIKTCLIPVITSNTEAWSNMSNREYESLEKIQKQALYNIFNISQSAPYIAFLSEIGILPAKKQILIKKINLYHTLKTSDDKRVAKKVLEQQEASEKEGSWYVELKNEVMKYDMAEVLEIGKTKKEVKKKVNETFKKQIEIDLSRAGTKSRFVKQFGEKRYLAELRKSDTKT